MNAFEEAKNKNESVVIDGIEYALIQQPYMDDTGIRFKSEAFSVDMLDEDGAHQSGLDESVAVFWDCYDDWNGEDGGAACDWDDAYTK